MEEIIRLVRDWADFKEGHAKADLLDFYRYQHAKISKPFEKGETKETGAMYEAGSVLLKTITRISSAFAIYTRIALKDSPLTSTDQFNFLAALNLLGETNKTEVTNYAMMEMSTGGDILNRLLLSGYISQHNDTADKRSKLIKITKAGKEVLKECFAKNVHVRDFLLKDLTEDDKKLCIQLLLPVEQKHGKLSVASKQKTLAQILSEEFN